MTVGVVAAVAVVAGLLYGLYLLIDRMMDLALKNQSPRASVQVRQRDEGAPLSAADRHFHGCHRRSTAMAAARISTPKETGPRR